MQTKIQVSIQKDCQKTCYRQQVEAKKTGAGAPVLLDSEDEEFIAKAIESKSTAHARRHDSTLYLNHRVKFDDLLSLVNYSLAKRGKKLLRSASTVYLRSRPKQLNTIEGRTHVGKWLFSTKKPPKTESHSNETTHHQRAHIKLNRIDVFQHKSEFKELGVEISFDDKACLRPGTDVGFRETKSGSIFQVADEEKQRKLPLHDFPVNKVYVTPSFRVMKWKVESINGIDNLVRTEHQSLVTVRPKYYVGSGGSVWASELLRIYYEEPGLFEVTIL